MIKSNSKPILIIIAGFPGVGKSYTARILKKKLSSCLYFDSDLFAKEYIEKHKIDFANLPPQKQNRKRLKFHRTKINKLKKDFKKFNTILLDTCFDLISSRKMFYKFAKNFGIKLVILEVKCSEKTVKNRILGKRQEKGRMVGTKESRWKIYKQIKSNWKPIKRKYFVINSEKDVKKQINRLYKNAIFS